MLCVFEGIDGSGKTTISKMVYNYLLHKLKYIKYYERSTIDFEYPFVREQMKTLRKLIWPTDDGEMHYTMGNNYWLFLQAAWFSVIEQNIIETKHTKDRILIFDSWFYRFIAKFINKGYKKEWLLSLFSVKEPDLVILLDLKPEIAWKRGRKFNKVEMGKSDGLDGSSFRSFYQYQNNIRNRLIEFAKEKSWIIVDSNESMPESICVNVSEAILSKISSFKRI